MPKKYIVDLSPGERNYLLKLTTTGKHPAYKVNHARILLKADINQPDGGWSDRAIASALDISISSIERLRRRFFEQGTRGGIKSSTWWRSTQTLRWKLRGTFIGDRLQ